MKIMTKRMIFIQQHHIKQLKLMVQRKTSSSLIDNSTVHMVDNYVHNPDFSDENDEINVDNTDVSYEDEQNWS